jgi:hypothetical protein
MSSLGRHSERKYYSRQNNILNLHFVRLAEDYNLELQYKRTFPEIWKEERDDPVLGPLSEVMRVVDRHTGKLAVSDQEMDAASKHFRYKLDYE